MNTRKQEEIDDYLFDKLPAVEKADFRQKMINDKNFKEDFLLQKEVVQNIQSYGNELLKNKLQAIHQEMLAQPKKRPVLLYVLGIACSIILLIFSVLFFNNFHQPNQTATFSNYYQPYPLSFQTRTSVPQKNDDAHAAQLLYQHQQYSEALPLLEKLSLDNPENPKFLLGKGICYIELKDWEKALTTFDSIVQLNESFFKDHAIWYASLIHFKLQDFQQAKNGLKILANNINADHYEEAQQVLKILEKKED